MIQLIQGPTTNCRGRRRGGTFGGVLITLSIIAALGVTTVILAPRYLVAGPSWEDVQPRLVTASQGGHRQLADSLALLVARSVGVLAIHQRGATPYLEVVLWLDDSSGSVRGRADTCELAVLSHSAVLRTITLYRLEQAPQDDPLDGAADPLAGPPRDSPEFCNRWRADPRMTPLILARGVSDMRLEPVGIAEDEWDEQGKWGGFQRLLLSLTWAPDSADGADEASVLVDTVMFSDGAWK